MSTSPSPWHWMAWLIALVIVVVVVGGIVLLIVKLAKGNSPNTATAGPPPISANPGWYPDPQNPRLMRYFDGRVWTSSTQPGA